MSRFRHRDAARILLSRRGLPQSSDSLGIAESIAQLKQKIAEIEERVEQTTDLYVAPPAVEAHRYSVKRPSAEYFYNKLASPKPIFPPQVKDTKVKAGSNAKKLAGDRYASKSRKGF